MRSGTTPAVKGSAMRLLFGLLIGLLLGGLLAVLLAAQMSGARRDDLEIFGRDDHAPSPSGAAT